MHYSCQHRNICKIALNNSLVTWLLLQGKWHSIQLNRLFMKNKVMDSWVFCLNLFHGINLTWLVNVVKAMNLIILSSDCWTQVLPQQLPWEICMYYIERERVLKSETPTLRQAHSSHLFLTVFLNSYRGFRAPLCGILVRCYLPKESTGECVSYINADRNLKDKIKLGEINWDSSLTKC